MPITNPEQLARALAEAENGTVTLDGILVALEPYQSVMGAMNELFRSIPSQAVLLILSTFAGTIIYDSRLQFPETKEEDWLELHKRHARIAFTHLQAKTEEDPRMAEYALSRQVRPQADPRTVRLTPKERRSTFSVLQGGAITIPRDAIPPDATALEINGKTVSLEDGAGLLDEEMQETLKDGLKKLGYGDDDAS